MQDLRSKMLRRIEGMRGHGGEDSDTSDLGSYPDTDGMQAANSLFLRGSSPARGVSLTVLTSSAVRFTINMIIESLSIQRRWA